MVAPRLVGLTSPPPFIRSAAAAPRDARDRCQTYTRSLDRRSFPAPGSEDSRRTAIHGRNPLQNDRMNDRSSDNDDLGNPPPGRAGDPGADDDPGPGEGSEAAEDERRSLQDRWHRFLSGKAEEERRRRLEHRRTRLREEDEPGVATPSGPESPPDGREGDAVAGSAEEPAPRTRAEELRSLRKARAAGTEPGAPVVVPAKEKMDLPFWRRRWRAIAAAAALLLVAFFLFRGGTGDAGDTTAADAGATSAEIEGIDAERVRALTDSLETAIGHYRERKRDFDLNRLGCAGLARGYEAVQSALGELRSAVPYADDLPDGPLRSRYRTLASSVDSVEQAFDTTGCGEAP